MKIISIILVTYNARRYVKACLDSIFTQGFQDYEIIIVDNASQDGTARFVKSKYPDITLIENKANIGPCKARNQGISRANGTYILCMDHDVRLYEDFLENIYKAIEGDEGIGAIQPKVLRADTKAIYSAGIYLSLLRRFHDIGSGRIDGKKFNHKRHVFGASAAAVLYRKKALKEIRQNGEYFDEDFFYFFEDVDISWRMRRKGWRVLYIPEAACSHAGGRSRNKDRVSQYLCLRNRYFVILKNESLIGFLRLPVILLLYDFWRILFMSVTNPKYLLKALYQVLVFAPKMLKKRYNA
jgi:GT2 family glycosyltransferase